MFRMNGMPRAQGCARAAKHILVSLDTRLPASYGPGTNYPPQRLANPVQNCQKPLTFRHLQSRGCAVPYFRTVSDMDVATERTRTYSQRVLK